MELVLPTMEMLPEYRDALEHGFAPHNINVERVRLQQLRMLDSDPEGLIALMDDREGKGPPIEQPDGSFKPRLPGITRWMWEDGTFLGSINLRWQNGTSQLPEGVPGHIGYTVAEWHRRKGYATRALILICKEARAIGLDYVELTTDEDNIASQRTIEKVGGRRIGTFAAGDLHHPCANTLLWRIDL